MKPLQHTFNKGSPMQADAACLIGLSLANGMPRTNGRNTTARSAVVTRLQSGLLGHSTGGLRYGLSYPSDAQTRFQGLWSKDRPVGVLPGLRGGQNHHW
jgi:hypothetical protein